MSNIASACSVSVETVRVKSGNFSVNVIWEGAEFARTFIMQRGYALYHTNAYPQNLCCLELDCC